MAIMKFTGTVLKNLFSKPATRLYPVVKREYPEATRGKVAIDIDSCIFCGLCSRKCPCGSITVDKSNKSWEIGRFGCIQCAACVDACPKKCLSMDTAYTSPAVKKSNDIYTATESPKPEEANPNA